ncbi:unnamed protein product [Allacma fusca]|uniref:Uncharacterized protein n=1 Tax=Allacma fusca TaxID=39272 RepID=A0A8J2LXJ4_9HEXA|nr:unnamed protein product [Allacma fusca]
MQESNKVPLTGCLVSGASRAVPINPCSEGQVEQLPVVNASHIQVLITISSDRGEKVVEIFCYSWFPSRTLLPNLRREVIVTKKNRRSIRSQLQKKRKFLHRELLSLALSTQWFFSIVYMACHTLYAVKTVNVTKTGLRLRSLPPYAIGLHISPLERSKKCGGKQRET